MRIFRNFKDLLQLLWNICGWLLLYIARLLSAWRKVCLYAIYYSFIWFNFVRSIKTKKSFSFFYKFKIKLVLIFNYSLGSLALLVASRVINNTSVCTDCVCDINVTCNLWPRRFAPTIFYHSNTNHQVEMGEHYPFVNHYMEKSLFILYMSFMYSLKLLFFLMWNLHFYISVLPKQKELLTIDKWRKPSLCLINTFNAFRHVYHCHA